MTAATEPPVIDLPGIYDIPEDVYFGASHALSCSGAKLLLPPSCPAKFFYRQDHQRHKAVFDFGSAAHTIVLESGPELVVIDADDWRAKATQQQRDEARAAGKTPVLARELARVQDMAAALRAHPVAYGLLDPYFGRPEQSLFWHDETGVMCRARLDWMPEPRAGERPIIADYKTCASAYPDDFAKAAANFGYHQQHAWYADGYEQVTGDRPAFVFIAQEKEPPYVVSVIELTPEAVRIGRDLNRRAIDIYRTCIASGEWPGYSDDIEQVALPAWARTRTDYY